MAESIALWFSEVFHSEFLSVFLISIIPMIEVRGAIPIGVSMGMNIWVSYVFATLSALVIAPILIVVLKPILKWLKTTKLFKKVATTIEGIFSDKANKLENRMVKNSMLNGGSVVAERRKSDLKKMFGIFLFVAFPLPLTGVWTGTAVAVFLNMKWYQVIAPVVLGNFVAGAIITLLTVLLGDKVSIILYVLFAFVLISITALGIGMYRKAKKKKVADIAQNVQQNTEEKDDGQL